MSYTLINNEDFKLISSSIPEPYARVISSFDTEELKKDKKLFPFKQRVPIDFKIITDEKIYPFLFEDYKNDLDCFKYNGASIPSWLVPLIGQTSDPCFLIPAFYHDIFCNHKELIGYDRYLSSLIFKELLISCGVSKFKALLMFIAVDNFQKLPSCNWKK